MNAEGICDDAPEEPTEFGLIEIKNDDMIGHYDDAGWTWDEAEATRTHPRDPELHYRVDPDTRAITLSAKLVEQLRRALGRPGKGSNP